MDDIMEIYCGVYGEGTWFAVEIVRNASVDTLQKAIAAVVSTDEHSVPPRFIALFLAKKRDGSWLKVDSTLEDFLTRGREGGGEEYGRILPGWKLSDDRYFGSNFQPGGGEIQVLVEIRAPSQPAQQQYEVWFVDGVVKDALSVKGIRCRLYELASSSLGLYDGDNKAFWYDDTNALRVHVLFADEKSARQFNNAVYEQTLNASSPMKNREVEASITRQTRVSWPVSRGIVVTDYVPADTSLPQQSNASFSGHSVSIIDEQTDVFRYQRIEKVGCFGRFGMAESCHIMSKAHCESHPTYAKFNRDENNRLALSRDLHGFYDGLNTAIPVFNIYLESIAQAPEVDERYEVKLRIRAVDADYGQLLADRLKEGSEVSEDPREMRTVVWVKTPKIFADCLNWKSKQIDKCWEKNSHLIGS